MLADAVEHVLCRSPSLQQALAAVSEQQGAVQVSSSAFLPRVSANAELSSDRIPSNNSGGSATGLSITGSIGLSWTLFDFGQRDASLSAARSALAAALSTQDATLLQSLTEVLRLYVEAASAWARREAAIENERVATLTVEIASARHAASVGSLLEKLQAVTAQAQSTLERVRAQGAWDSARGALASAMGQSASQPVSLAPAGGFRGIADADLAFASLRTEALADHPRLRALRAERASLQARYEALRAQARGVVALNSSLGITRGLSGGGSNDRSLGTSISASVPLFNHTEQQGREMQLLSQITAKEAGIDEAERAVELDLWRAMQLATSESANLRAARSLLDAAETAHNIALGRYKSGVGAMLEMLSAQSALAQAQASAAQAEITAISARVRLSLAAGRIQLTPK
jgi:outer membrane protein